MYNKCALSDTFIKNNINQSFLNKLIEKQRQIEFDRLKLQIPQAMHYVDLYQQSKQIKKEICDIDSQISAKYKEIATLRHQEQDYMRTYDQMLQQIYSRKRKNINKYTDAPVKCPVIDCKGYLDTSIMICPLCENKICSRCHKVKNLTDDNDNDNDIITSSSNDDSNGNNNDNDNKDKKQKHVCNPDDIESVKYVKQNSRPCPKCGTRISKIDGCDQMWCINPECQTTFSWNTGEVCKSGTWLHNPEFFRYMRDKGQEVNRMNYVDNQNNNCRDNQQIIYNFISRTKTVLRLHASLDAEMRQKITVLQYVAQSLGHLRETENSLERTKRVLENENHMMSMVQYITDELSEKRLYSITTQKHRKIKKINDYYSVFYSLRLILEEAILHLCDQSSILDDIGLIEQSYKQCETAREFINKEFRIIAKRYKSKCYDLNYTYRNIPFPIPI
tara:strand:- start:524 stop:1861 length:1338 start_codon:yes stop_codon:yes gene_type:complete